MKKTMIRKFITAAALAAMFLGCAGCGFRQEDASEVVYNVGAVLGYTNHSPIVDLEIPELQLAAYPNSRYLCVLPSGKPQLICQDTIPDNGGNGYTKRMIQRLENTIQEDMEAHITQAAIPSSPQVDMAGAMEMAVRGIRANASEDSRNLLLIYSGCLSTSGLIQMQNVPLTQLDVQRSAEEVAEQMNLDLDGIGVKIYCCGDVAGDEQPPLSMEEKKNIKGFYRILMETMGAEEVIFSDAIPPAGSYSFDMPVDVVPTQQEQSGLALVDSSALSEDGTRKALEEGAVLSIDIAFKSDSTELQDPLKAAAALENVINYMKTSPDACLLVCGTTANTGNKQACLRFSADRSEVIRDQLIQCGIDESRIRTIGCGYSCSLLYRPDQNPDGSLNANAAFNRAVKIMDLNSPTAAKILQAQEEGDWG